MSTVEELRLRLRTPGQVVREDEFDPDQQYDSMTVFRSLPDGRCETWLRTDDVEFHHQEFGSESEAVDEAAGRIFGTTPQPGSVRTLSGPPATTVEELKDAMAELGRDPDTVTRAEVLRDSPPIEGMTAVETRPDGTVRTCSLERGREHDIQEFADEAAAIAPLYARLTRSPEREVSDLDVERMRLRAARFRHLMATRGAR